MATRKPMKFKRYDEGGSVEESKAKQRGLEISNKEEPVGFFERLRMGNIDQPGSEAYNRFGAGRAYAKTMEDEGEAMRAAQRAPSAPAAPAPSARPLSDDMYSDFGPSEGRSSTETVKPTRPAASKPTVPASKPASKPAVSDVPRLSTSGPMRGMRSDTSSPKYAGPMRGMRSDAGTSPPVGNARRPDEGSAASKMDVSGMRDKAKAALAEDPTALMGAGAGAAAAALLARTNLGKLFKGAKDIGAKRLERPGTVAGKDFVVRDYEGAAKAGAKGSPKKQLGYSKDADVTDVTPKKTSYRSETNPTKREDAKADEARERLKKFTSSSAKEKSKVDDDFDKWLRSGYGMKKGGSVKKYASGGTVSSASKRGDGIATKGKTRCKIC